MTMRTPIFGGNNTAPSATATKYTSLTATMGSIWGASDAVSRSIMPEAVTLYNLCVQLTTAPGAGASRTFTVMKNNVATALTITISGASQTLAIDTTNSVSFVAGDAVSLKSDVSSSPNPAAAGVCNWYCVASSTDAIILAQNSTNIATSGTQYTNACGSQNQVWGTTEADWAMPVPCAGQVVGFYVELEGGGPGGVASYTFSIVKNGTPTTSAVAIIGAATTGNDVTDLISFAAGDTLSVQVIPAGTPTARACRWGIAYAPTVSGNSFTGFSNNLSPSTSATNYNQINGAGGAAWSATEANFQMLAPPCTSGPVYVKVTTAPGGAGSGKKYDYKLRKNKTTALNTVTISETATSGNSATTNALSANDLLEIQAIPTSTPTAPAGAHIGVMFSGVAIQYTGSAALAGSGVLASTGVRTRYGVASPAGTGTLAATATHAAFAAGALAGSGTLAAPGIRTRFGAAAFAGTGVLSAAGVRTRFANAALSGVGSLNASGTRTRYGSAALTGAGVLAATGVRTVLGSDAIAGAGVLAASGTRTEYGIAQLAGLGTLAAAAVVTAQSSQTWGGTGGPPRPWTEPTPPLASDYDNEAAMALTLLLTA